MSACLGDIGENANFPLRFDVALYIVRHLALFHPYVLSFSSTDILLSLDHSSDCSTTSSNGDPIHLIDRYPADDVHAGFSEQVSPELTYAPDPY